MCAHLSIIKPHTILLRCDLVSARRVCVCSEAIRARGSRPTASSNLQPCVLAPHYPTCGCVIVIYWTSAELKPVNFKRLCLCKVSPGIYSSTIVCTQTLFCANKYTITKAIKFRLLMLGSLEEEGCLKNGVCDSCAKNANCMVFSPLFCIIKWECL
jgi:hypothetical protein